MDIEDKSEKLIVKLTRETYSASVSWEVKKPPTGLTEGSNDVFPLYLETHYKNVDIGLFQKRYKHFYDELEYSWAEEIGMCITGEQGRVLWEYKESSPALLNLFEAAREQASGINGILDNLLED
ncbi:hypothetical protein [Nitrosomonas marina]|uniref:Uncharacterized protein n=1 Tax=Nitrosomonas marina TaxID=917 RepID=A0A1H8FVQ3_9PROT|nr:hypothetical protein [Nitrosomonas marina]SEN35742.1 hypothetical protein SAMN05216325_1152 [Nitrosomonas marina]